MNPFGDSDSDSDADNVIDLKINEQFAKRFELNKKRDDLMRLEELKKRGLVDESKSDDDEGVDDDDKEEDEEEVDVTGVVSKKKDLRIFDVLLKVKNRDPSVKDPSAKLFDDSSDSEDEERENEDSKRKDKKTRYLKDVIARQLIKDGPEMEEKEEVRRRVKSFDEEQDEMRRELLEALEKAEKEADGDGDLFTVKRRDDDEEMDEEDQELKKRVNDYFGDELDENEMFLKEFFENKMWMRKEEGNDSVDEGDLAEVSEDEEELEKQEDFEREYNFRYEEDAGDRILGHSRFVEGSVRKKENARKRQRERKEERIAQATKAMKEEVKRLKNLKKKEITKKLNKLREVAGLGEGSSIPLTAADLEEDFDPEEHDKKMNAAFGEEYYGADDPEFGSDMDEDGVGLGKPDFDKEDELIGLPKDWDVCKPGEGFSSERGRCLKSKGDSEAAVPQGGEDDKDEEGKKKIKKKLSSEEKAAIEKDLDELYKLDYEDSIGDLKTRFKYKTVEPRRYALNPTELLLMDDKELNQYVSLKKLAPYQEQEWKVPSRKRAMIKKQLREKLHGEKLQVHKGKKSKSLDSNSNAVEAENNKGEQPADDVAGLSRQAKRKRRQAELKPPESRLTAYGMPMAPKKKSKKKSVKS
ncbi:hypothetical protein Droror1_Dr00023288 [Drosera rotundifolia]